MAVATPERQERIEEIPRYEVHSITGYTINPAITGPGGTGGQAKQRTSYCVLDTAYCYREVGSFYVLPGRGGPISEAKLRAQAEALCARLNAEEAAECGRYALPEQP